MLSEYGENTFLSVKAKAYSIQIKDSVMTYQYWAGIAASREWVVPAALQI